MQFRHKPSSKKDKETKMGRGQTEMVMFFFLTYCKLSQALALANKIHIGLHFRSHQIYS